MTEEGGTNGVNIGNYKGVMLCNRPFNGLQVSSSKPIEPSTNNRFLTGIPKEKIGQNVPIHSEPLYSVKRDKKNTALSKHKKWLYDLQREKERLEEALAQEDVRKEEKRRKFSEREAKMRAMIRENIPSEVPETNDEYQIKKSNENKKNKKNKPMWALTKETADEELDRREEEEVLDLIDFANNLDIDKFMDDVEKKAMIEQVKQRMNQIQSTVDEEEEILRKLDEDSQSDCKEAKVIPLTAKSLAKLDSNSNDGEDEDDTKSIATTVISECKSIRSIHSARSVAALTKRLQDKLSNKLNTISEDSNPTMPPPKVVTHDEEQGIRISKKNNPSNLPYIHRNPAI